MVFKTFSFYAMSDIHGNYDAFDRALRFVESHATLVLLGDYVDGGPSSRQVLEKLFQLDFDPTLSTIFLFGNHDEWFYQWLHTPELAPTAYASQIGWSTICSFFGPVELQTVLMATAQTGTPQTGYALNHVCEDELRRRILTNYPELMAWWTAKFEEKRYFETENQIFVHAGIAENLGEYWQYDSTDLFTKKYPATIGDFSKTIIAGHIHTEKITNDQHDFGRVYWDGHSHFYLDGHTSDSGIVPVLRYRSIIDRYDTFKQPVQNNQVKLCRFK
ncbi:metallophosphoesterase family protein [Lapidilactobacillus gannanensis]|jgi:serine/threonine protein phosphatase 1|uniref:Metallophosphoesterase family protein n=1 Tax=Lapidilactobacillus gannanensis TaxID=2486002 RepID=A0ABW4BSA0_9LACO|nr:metallophosphoesterase [Lapidilactobacillus gannanensis]MCH4057494.1 metallophosphoesterase [Lactobacillaceae bacterium]